MIKEGDLVRCIHTQLDTNNHILPRDVYFVVESVWQAGSGTSFSLTAFPDSRHIFHAGAFEKVPWDSITKLERALLDLSK